MLKPSNIRACWPFVKEGLEEVKALRGGTWRLEDIYADCVHGKAYLWLCDDGFVIFRPETDAYSLKSILLVWMAWGKGSEDLIEKYEPQILSIAKDQNFDVIRFYRHPKGPVEHRGWQRAYTVYEREV